MAKVKNFEAFCNHCQAVTKWELAGSVGDSFDQGMVWAKCKKCKQTALISSESINSNSKINVRDIATDKSVDYSPKNTYAVGESIYHKTWDDFGVVTGKEILSNGKQSITVEFQKSGAKKLLESINF